MELQLTQAQESRLAEVAEREGKSVSELLVDAAVSVLQIEERHLASIDRALAQIDRGEFIEEEEMDLRVAKMLAR